MIEDDIIRMAQKCGHWSGETIEMNDVGIMDFAALVAAAEREACAKLAREIGNATEFDDWALEKCGEIETAIRARSQAIPTPPAGYTAEELERDNPYNQWSQS